MEAPVKATPKELSRQFIKNRIAEHRPPPAMKEIRRQLGWDLIDAARMESPV